MCGIAAIFQYRGAPAADAHKEMQRVLAHMNHRGPDGEGEWVSADKSVLLGHRRLAIIDLSNDGAQPMSNMGASSVIVFNGEIYNFAELKKELESKGRVFQSRSDTEVLLQLYDEYGEDMLVKLRGMYAFAIWDQKASSLFLARDPFGIKPLYFADDGKTFRLASQVKALLAGGAIDRTPEPAGHVGFFLWGHVPEPYTLYRGIRSLPAGTWMRVNGDEPSAPTPFCSIPDLLFQAESDENPDAYYPDDIRSAVLDSVRAHLIADVPVGVFLSAGIDSTTLAALASEAGGTLRTITLGFEEFRNTPNDEVPLAEQVAREYGAHHKTIWVTRADFQNQFERLMDSMDQPSTDGVNTYFVSRAAAQTGVKVVLSGLGGDEVFGGYPSFQQIPRLVQTLGPLAIFGPALRAVSSTVLRRFTSPKYAGLFEYGGTWSGAYLLRRGMFMPWELPRLLDPDLVREGWRELQTLPRLDQTAQGVNTPHLKISALEMCWYMRNQLLRDSDWASMAHSLELRVPLLDVPLLKKLAPSFTTTRPLTKRDLAATPKQKLPDAIINRPKSGFTVPVRDWLTAGNPQSAIRNPQSDERGLRGWARMVHARFSAN